MAGTLLYLSASKLALDQRISSIIEVQHIIRFKSQAVVVLPHHLGPAICTAPNASSLNSRVLSAILFK